MNQCQLLGRLVRDPELRYTQQGTPVCSFTLAVDRRFNRDKTDYIRVIAWRNTAEFCANYFQKGSRIALVGSIQTRTGKTTAARNTAKSRLSPIQSTSPNPKEIISLKVLSKTLSQAVILYLWTWTKIAPFNGPAGEGRESTWTQKDESAETLKTYFRTTTRRL